jgi:hypothetical protein
MRLLDIHHHSSQIILLQRYYAIEAGGNQEKSKRGRLCAFLSYISFGSLCLGSDDLTAIVGTASLASSVRHNGLTALGANGHAGSRQLPVAATALIATGLGHFTLRNSHG